MELLNATPACSIPKNDSLAICSVSRRIRLENLAHTGIRSPDRPAPSMSLYWLSYPGQHTHRAQRRIKLLGAPRQ